MAARICEICGVRPASVRVTMVQDGVRENLDVCDYDYARLTRHQQYQSPLESLFGGDPFGGFMDSGGPGRAAMGRRGATSPDSPGESDFTQRFSDQSKEMLQRAAERAVQEGRREVDTEHLLYVLPDSDVVQVIFKQFKVSIDELRREIDKDRAPPQEPAKDGKNDNLGVSPRLKGALDHAYAASRELGHSYIGPEHLLAGPGRSARQLCGGAPEEVRPDSTGAPAENHQGRWQGSGRRSVDALRARPNSTNSAAT